MTRRAARRSSRSTGFTLVEVIVVLAMLAMGAALTLPALTGGPREERSFGQVVRDARRTAIARAQPLRLDLSGSGTWTLTSIRDDQRIADGSLDDGSPVGAARIEFAASGGCQLRTPLPPHWASWDAARCTALPRRP